ncbi:hypothetical protein RBWH47_02958 [Rhodopirellula baltica WH47]|uniref:Uncharacterized protein n=1 Tax=Rhodopirellula baltica WH47 TaxID=991778 RepID=F2AZL2_RHOBT|nr:hypothetical protein RBWH47_02958 [Rhodopirellula baltica WH47]
MSNRNPRVRDHDQATSGEFRRIDSMDHLSNECPLSAVVRF